MKNISSMRLRMKMNYNKKDCRMEKEPKKNGSSTFFLSFSFFWGDFLIKKI